MSSRKEIIGIKATKCHTFILPMLGIDPRTLPSNYINTYIYDTDCLILIFDYIKDDVEFTEFLLRLDDNPSYTKYEDNNLEILLYFNVFNEFKDDYNKFLNGKYSKFSMKYKDILCKIYGRTSIKDSYKVTVYNAIYPQQFKREQIAERLCVKDIIVDEVLDVLDFETENYVPIYELINNQNKQTL